MLDKDTVTHHAEYDIQERPRTVIQAICGAYIRKFQSVAQPSCPVCRQILAARDAEPEPALRLS